jgi:hypothetical protein
MYQHTSPEQLGYPMTTNAQPGGNMNKKIVAKPSLIPPDRMGNCTICLHQGADIWSKLYRTLDWARNEAEAMGWTKRQFLTHPDIPLPATFQQGLLPEVPFDPVELEKHGYRKRMSEPAST